MIKSLNDCKVEVTNKSILYQNDKTGNTILQASINKWDDIPYVVLIFNTAHNKRNNIHSDWIYFVRRYDTPITNKLMLNKINLAEEANNGK